MIELLPWLTLILLLILYCVMHSTDVNKPLAAGVTLIVIGGLFYLTAAFSEPTEPSYSAMDVLLVFPMLIKSLYYALERATAPAFGLLALIGVLPTAVGCIQIRLQRKRDEKNGCMPRRLMMR